MPDINNQNGQNYAQPNGGQQQGKVIKGTAQIDKPSFGKRVVNFLFSDRIDSITGYLTTYILGPSIKDLIFKMGTGALQMALFGGLNGVAGGGMNSGNYIPGYGYQTARRDPVPYHMIANPNGYAAPATQSMMYPQYVAVNEVSFETKDDAYLVLDRMRNDLQRYGKVKVADFYNAAGITGQEGNWTLQGNGWYNLDGVGPIMRTDGRWMINFPPVQALR